MIFLIGLINLKNYHYIFKIFGSTSLDQVLDALEYAVYVHDVQHIILDNLQFMLSSQTLASKGFEKWDIQDKALDSFRQFATANNVHITLVIHPRKEQGPDQPLYLNSVFGSAKATQEADNVIIIQSRPDPNDNNIYNLNDSARKLRQIEIRKIDMMVIVDQFHLFLVKLQIELLKQLINL